MWVSSTSCARRRQSYVSSRRHGNSILQSSLIGAAAVAVGLSLAAPVWADVATVENDSKAVDQLPKIKILEAESSVHLDVIVGGRWACPSRIRVRWQVSGHGPGVAAVALFDKNSSSGSLFGPEEIKLQQGSEEIFVANHDISWPPSSASSAPPTPQDVSYLARVRMNAGTSESFIADEDELARTLRCRPAWPRASIKVKVVESVPVGGRFLCPSRYQVTGNLTGRSHVPGTVELLAERERFGPVRFALAEGADLSVGPFERTLEWKELKGAHLGAAARPQPMPEQRIRLSMKVFGIAGNTLETISKIEAMKCTPMAGIVPGGSAQLPDSSYKLKVHVAGGTIRLQGAQPNAVYLLQFHHQSKLGGKFKRVKASHLPTKAKGGVAKVTLAKLTPGQWRVEVCATQGGRGVRMLPGSCIPGTFEVRRAAIGGFGEAFQ